MIPFANVLQIKMTIRRNKAFVVSTFLMPVLALALLSSCSFLLPPQSEAKLDILVNLMLSYAVYVLILGESLPPSGNETQPILCEFYNTVYFDARKLINKHSCQWILILILVSMG